MENKYVITASGTLVSVDELKHAGILGMKWGIRRYQNEDGSLTEAGRKRYLKSDGTLNDRGKKFYDEENKRLKAERAKIKALKESNAKFDTLDKMRKANQELENKTKRKADEADVDAEVDTPKSKTTSDMSDKELQDRVNRLRNEDAYRDLNKKLGYNDGPKTELDAKIAEMEKQKKYLELQRDIKNLTPKKEDGAFKKLMGKLIDDVVVPSAVEAGKKTLTSYLTEAGAQAVSKTTKSYAEKIEKSINDSKKRVDEKAAKEKAKAEKKAEKERVKAEKKAAAAEAKAAADEAKAERKAAKAEARAEAKAKRAEFWAEELARTREDQDRAAEQLVDYVSNTAKKMKSAPDTYGTKAYERKVDRILAEMDDKAWDIYYQDKKRDDD